MCGCHVAGNSKRRVRESSHVDDGDHAAASVASGSRRDQADVDDEERDEAAAELDSFVDALYEKR